MIRLLLTSGRGPAECRIALAKTLNAFAREADALGLDVDIVETPATDEWGPPSALAVVHGDAAAAFAIQWIGSIQWTARSPIRPHHKRKNWFVSVFALPAERPAPKPLASSDVRFEVFRAGGPGGQHQNKTESAVRAVHIPSGLAVVARDDRSQHRNKALALGRLAALLELGQELQTLADQQHAHDQHERLERGSPVRRFEGEAFRPV